ncbi:hypothetical protein J3E69DRAFT_332003 [Trichoderma sp. SZMC 28015]
MTSFTCKCEVSFSPQCTHHQSNLGAHHFSLLGLSLLLLRVCLGLLFNATACFSWRIVYPVRSGKTESGRLLVIHMFISSPLSVFARAFKRLCASFSVLSREGFCGCGYWVFVIPSDLRLGACHFEKRVRPAHLTGSMGRSPSLHKISARRKKGQAL